MQIGDLDDGLVVFSFHGEAVVLANSLSSSHIMLLYCYLHDCQPIFSFGDERRANAKLIEVG